MGHCPAEAGLRRNKPVSLAHLAQHKIVLPDALHGIRTLVEHACAVTQVMLDICAEANALSVQRALVLGGHGWTTLPPIAVAEDLRARRLSGAPLSVPAISGSIVLALPAQHAVTCVIELLEQEMRSAIQSGEWLVGR